MSFTDKAAEYRLLACMVDTPDLVLKYTDELFTGDCVQLFHAMRQAYERYGELSSEGVEKFYGRSIPNEIEIARGARPNAIADKLIGVATLRQLNTVSERVVAMLGAKVTDRDAITRELVLKPLMVSEDTNIAPGVSEFVTDLQRKMSGQYRFIDTGLPTLNHMLGGEWPRQALTVMMGQAGGGKTALVCQSILNMARKGIPTFFASLEMPKARLISRFVAHITKIDGMRIKRGDITAEEVKLVDAALEEVQSLPIFISDKPGQTIDEIVYQVKMNKEAHGIEAFFVDYIQIISRSNVTDNMSEELGELAQRLRNVAVEEDIAAIVLSQQNRMHTGLASILGSGRISHIADAVFEIQIDAQSTNDVERIGSFNFHKNRDGALGAISCKYRPKYLEFV